MKRKRSSRQFSLNLPDSMANSKEIRSRIKSVRNTGKITRAMELISTVKMKKAQDLAVGARPFVLEAARILSEMDLKEQKTNPSHKEIILVITSNKGLCGGYNVNIFKEIARIARENPETAFEFVTAGKRAKEFVLRTGGTLLADFSEEIRDTIGASETRKVSRFLQDAYRTGKYDRIRISYSHYISAIAQKPITKTMLPLSRTDLEDFFASLGIVVGAPDPTVVYEYEPDKETIVAAALPLVYDSIVKEALLEGKASEHAARMIAMKNAKDSANKKVKSLTLSYNKARQSAITKEVSEIVSGVESMKE